MNLWTEKDSNGIELLKTSWRFIIHKPKYILYALLIVANTLFCFSLFFFFEYHFYGINMWYVDANTIENLFSLTVIEHIKHVLQLVGVIIVSIFCSLLFHAGFTYTVVSDLLGKQTSIFRSLLFVLKHLRDISYLSVIYFNHYFSIVLDVIALAPFIRMLQYTLEGRENETRTITKSHKGMLVVPVLLFDTSGTLSEHIVTSQQLLNGTFAPKEGSDVSFFKVQFFFFIVALSVIIACFKSGYNHTIAVTFISSFILLIILKIIEIGLIMYRSCLYAYITKKASGPFSPADLEKFI